MPIRQTGAYMSKQKNGKSEKISLRERLCKSLDIQPDISERDNLIEIRGQHKITVRGTCRIISYSPDEVRLRTQRGELDIRGKRLFCSAYSTGSIEIEGLINDLSFKEIC